MTNLVDDLRARLQAASNARNEVVAQVAQPRGQSIEEMAARQIAALPLLLKEAASRGRSCDVMRLNFELRLDVQVLARASEYDNENLVDYLTGHIKIVAQWLRDQGLTITVRNERKSDEGQGRVWMESTLVASW